MAYTLVHEGAEPLIDLEFDRLYAQLFEGAPTPVRARCEELLARDPDCTWPHLLLGYIELSDNNFQSAYDHFSQVARCAPPLISESRAGIGRALVGLGRTTDALNLLQDLVSSSPRCHFAWHALGELLASLGDFENVWICAQQATSLCPTNTGAVSLLVSAGNTLSRHAELIELLSIVQNEQPWNLDVRGARAISLLRAGQHAEAVTEMSRVVAFAPFARVSPAVLQVIRQSISDLGAHGG